MTFQCHILWYNATKEDFMQVNRLFEIVYLLLDRKTVTANELAEHFGVSPRTIYRDIDILSTANIPIYTNKGKGGGICLLEDFVLNKSMLTEDEQNQILFALQSMEKISAERQEKLLEKMSTFFHKTRRNWIEIDLSSWGNTSEQEQNFQLIQEAILQQKVLQFVYHNTNGEEKKRQAEPLQLYFKDKAWYLKAYARDREDYRLFKIARMRKIEKLEETFERELPEFIEKEPHFSTVKLVLEISQSQAYRVYDEFEKKQITKQPNGDFIVKAEFPENDWVYGYILSFGEFAKVISPDYVKERIQKSLKRSWRNYFL